MSRRPDDAGVLSPAAKAILQEAKEIPWSNDRVYPRLVLRGEDETRSGTLVAHVDAGTSAVSNACAEAITASVNAYARDRELLDALRRMHRAAVISADGVVRCLVCGMNYRGEERHGGNCAAGFAQQVLAALGTEA